MLALFMHIGYKCRRFEIKKMPPIWFFYVFFFSFHENSKKCLILSFAMSCLSIFLKWKKIVLESQTVATFLIIIALPLYLYVVCKVSFLFHCSVIYAALPFTYAIVLLVFFIYLNNCTGIITQNILVARVGNSNDACHEKTDLKAFVIVIPKEGWARPRQRP